MIFGDAVDAPATVAAAEWIAGACRGEWGTVGALVPNRYPSVVRMRAPDQSVEHWWSAYRDLYEVVAATGGQHTATVDRAWFAVWEGYGFANQATLIAWEGSADEAALAREQARLRDEDQRRNAAVRTALRQLPRFELPNRMYYLVTGPVSAVTGLREPGPRAGWQRPDLFWPDDRRWFVATDVDFWSLYIGGDHDFLSELARGASTSCEVVALDDPLEPED